MNRHRNHRLDRRRREVKEALAELNDMLAKWSGYDTGCLAPGSAVTIPTGFVWLGEDNEIYQQPFRSSSPADNQGTP